MMPRHTTASLLCAIATLLLLFSTTASAAPACNSTNYLCFQGDGYFVGETAMCKCCPRDGASICTAAVPRCNVGFYTCPSSHSIIGFVNDSCQCCDASDACVNCPSVTDERCISCRDDRCDVCIDGYWTLRGSRCLTCAVPHCEKCMEDNGRMCATCQGGYKLADDHSCEDGALGLQSSYVAAAAATLVMMLALVV